jgi:hypothetical protein
MSGEAVADIALIGLAVMVSCHVSLVQTLARIELSLNAVNNM